jgi:CheY-like chemotaxis protein
MSQQKPATRVILVADDDKDDQALISNSFDDIGSGCLVEVVSNGQLALKRLQDRGQPRPCLIVLDLNMPIMGGMETLMHIRSNPEWSDVPVVVFTTSTSKESKTQSLKLGAKDHIVKPYDYNAFMEISQKMLAYCRQG